jgi:hypothetical protein
MEPDSSLRFVKFGAGSAYDCANVWGYFAPWFQDDCDWGERCSGGTCRDVSRAFQRHRRRITDHQCQRLWFCEFREGVYDPAGDIGPATTVLQSYVALPNVEGRLDLGDIPVGATEISVSDIEYVTSFDMNRLSFTLTQRLVDWVESEVRVSTALAQQFGITNSAEFVNTFDMVRYRDGELYIVGTLRDGGGRILAGNNGSCSKPMERTSATPAPPL